MAKRFADTDKYKKSFIRSLPAAYKLLWDYICLDCNHSGIWEVDFEVAQIRIGQDAPVEKSKAIELFNSGEERIQILNHGSKWLIVPFIEFQYGHLNPKNRVHASILEKIEKEGVKGLASPLQGAKDKDKEKEKDKDKEKEYYNEVKKEEFGSSHKEFVTFWCDEFKRKFECSYVFNGSKDGQTVKRLLATHSLEDLKSLAEAFFDDQDDFVIKAGRTIGVFSTQVNRLAQNMSIIKFRKAVKK